jgi:hypothetical protein
MLFSCEFSDHKVKENKKRSYESSEKLKNNQESLMNTSAIFSIDKKYSMRIYQSVDICDNWLDRESTYHQFICVEITKQNDLSFDLITGAQHNNIAFYDDNYIVSPVCCQKALSSPSSLNLLFTIDAFDKFKEEIAFTFSYGFKPYTSFKNSEITNLLRSFTVDSSNNQTPFADSAWLISKGLSNFLVKNK